ncbi:MAG: tetratricopeptide repeat protein [Fibrobacteria bacterium]|nr:tetratricopeptide repeat protein [Fibrobacteria bacterium]
MKMFFKVLLSWFMVLNLVLSVGYAAGKNIKASASSPPAVQEMEEGTPVFKTSIHIKSHKPYWWVKTAGIKDKAGKRYCAEDKSKGKKNSRIILNEVFVSYPNMKGENGLFNVKIHSSEAFNEVKDMTTCTYTANMFYRHGNTDYNVKNTFVLNLSPSASAEKEVPKKILTPQVSQAPETKVAPVKKVEAPKKVEKKEEPKPAVKVEAPKAPEKKVVPKPEVKAEAPKAPEKPETPNPVIKKEEPVKAPEVAEKAPVKVEPPKAAPAAQPKVFQAEDMAEPEKVEVSEDVKLAMVKEEPVQPEVTIKKPTSNYKKGIDAFKAKKYADAVAAFKKVPVPKTRQRGVPEREEFVKASFYKGMAYQKEGNFKDAANAYKDVLKYEKYFPLVNMNLGICYMELRQYAKAHKSFDKVIRDQNRISPDQYDDVMQRTRYFWAITWTRLFRAASDPDKALYFKRQANSKWQEYKSWFGKDKKFKTANEQADLYISSLK